MTLLFCMLQPDLEVLKEAVNPCNKIFPLTSGYQGEYLYSQKREMDF